jgi:hypothetical protein
MNLRATKRRYQHFREKYSRLSSVCITSLIFLFSAACGKSSAPSPASPREPVQSAATSDPQPVEFDACTLYSAAEAAQLLGTPVRPVTNVGGCSYESAAAIGGAWRRQTVLNVRKYKSASDEKSAWEDFKILRHLQPGRKNLAVVSGIGAEAYLETIPNGKFTEASVIVHTSSSDFQLKEITEEKPSPDALKTIAQKVAAQLP